MSGTIMDVFNGNAFSSVTLTDRVNTNYPEIPLMLTNMNIAQSSGMLTTTAAFEDVTGGIRLIPSSPRGAPPSQRANPTGALRYLNAQRFAREVEINADELLAARVRGGDVAQTLQNLIMERVDGPIGVRMDWALTMEHMLLGAIDGQVLDADNTKVLFDYYSWTGTSRPASVAIPFSTATKDTDKVSSAALAIKRQMSKALSGMAAVGVEIVVLCGDNFFDKLVGNPEARELLKVGAFGNPNGAMSISDYQPYSAIRFAGITWINYRGTDDNSTVAVPTDEARAFPRGVPGLFQILYAPADTFETVSTVGLPLYMLRRPSRQTESRAVWELQSNPIIACLRPTALLRLTMS